MSLRSFSKLILSASSALSALVLGLTFEPHLAQSADAPKPASITYAVSIAFIPIGTAQLSESFRGNSYHLHLVAEFSGLVRLFFAPGLSANSEGTDANGRLLAQRYQLSIDQPNDPQRVDMKMVGGNVVSSELDPPLPERADRVPVLPEHKKGIVDPLSGLLIPSTSTPPQTGQVCDRVLPVFDGAGRFDITLMPNADLHFEAEGFAGPAVSCFVHYTAISGHRAKKTNVTFMENNRDITVTLAPLPGKPYLIPLEISVATLIGNLRLKAIKVEGLGTTSPTQAAN